MRAVVLDRTAVLFVGVAMGVMMGLAFASHAPAPPRVAPAASAASAAPARTPAIKAAAARAAECDVPVQARMLQTLAKGGQINVGVFGDSFGDGVWAALYRRLPKSDHYNVVKFSQESTGLTRYDLASLEDRTTAQIASQPVDVAVIDFGANDMRGIVQDGHVYQLFTPAWRVAYGQRIDRMVALLRSRGAVVYWVGLPKMRDAAYDQDVAQMNAFLSDHMAQLGVPFIDTQPLSVDQSGAFNAYLPTPGGTEPKLMRANDGIHMTMAGYELITAPLVDRIQAYVAQSRKAAAALSPAGPAAPAGQAVAAPAEAAGAAPVSPAA
ncbi:DUF459 domain-containing protein [Caulobacter sp. KR2-114]|uniref:SGNH/GDSL hydrolase family protein n=1 Tax=Caulobacter sp. KR2-114 TaxID=3400912 RepID=UPI003C0417AE